MNSQADSKSEISANHQDFQEISSRRKASSCGLLARDVRFEPTPSFCSSGRMLGSSGKNRKSAHHEKLAHKKAIGQVSS